MDILVDGRLEDSLVGQVTGRLKGNPIAGLEGKLKGKLKGSLKGSNTRHLLPEWRRLPSW